MRVPVWETFLHRQTPLLHTGISVFLLHLSNAEPGQVKLVALARFNQRK